MNPPCLQPPVRVQENYSHVDLDDMKWKESFAHDRWRDLSQIASYLFCASDKRTFKGIPRLQEGHQEYLTISSHSGVQATRIALHQIVAKYKHQRKQTG